MQYLPRTRATAHTGWFVLLLAGALSAAGCATPSSRGLTPKAAAEYEQAIDKCNQALTTYKRRRATLEQLRAMTHQALVHANKELHSQRTQLAQLERRLTSLQSLTRKQRAQVGPIDTACKGAATVGP